MFITKWLIITTWLLFYWPSESTAQDGYFLIDQRDGQKYATTTIDGTVWMAENLAFATELSFGPPDTLLSLQPDFKGRWYHMSEIKSICPSGWRLPYLEDWLNYFNYLANNSNGNYELITWTTDYRLTNFEEYFDLFEEGNPLTILPAGIYEGNAFMYRPGSADYWMMDIIPRHQSEKKSFKVVKKSYPGKAHIHLYNQYTHIHSHDHHLENEKPDQIRRFLCRCVEE